jgi:large subunit ribosomal protein L22
MNDLFVKEIYIDGGAMLKRMRPRAKGSGARILKHTSHVTIVVADAK